MIRFEIAPSTFTKDDHGHVLGGMMIISTLAIELEGAWTKVAIIYSMLKAKAESRLGSSNAVIMQSR